MRGFKYLLLFAWIVAVASLSAERERKIDGRKPLPLGIHGGQVTGALHKRDEIKFCRFWAQSSELVGEKVYLSGGLATTLADYRDGSLYYSFSAIEIDLTSGVEFPIYSDDQKMTSYAMKDGESTQQGAFWWDGNNTIYKYGGWFVDYPTFVQPDAVVRPADVWRLDLTYGTWDNTSINPFLYRAWGGAVATVPEEQIGYFLGGIVENRTDTAFEDAPGYLLLQDNFLNFDSSSNSFVNKTAPELGHIALGNLVHIPDMGDGGLLIYLGGAEGPSGWVPTDTTDGMTLRDLGTVWVYDISSSQWYSQKASGDTPEGRISACAVVVPSQDKSSWNIVLHGGGDLGLKTGKVYGETWVLSLPSFQWTMMDDKGDKKFEHTCHLVKGNQMLVIGGRDKLQWYAGDPASNYSGDGSKWTCLTNGIITSLNLNTFEWEDALPDYNTSYEVHEVILGLIGGNATGGANVLAPLGGWDDDALGTIMWVDPPTPLPTPTPSTTTHSSTSTKAVPTTSPPGPVEGQTNKKDLPVGAIVGGVVGGVFLIALIALVVIFLRKRNLDKSEVPATITGPVPPDAQTPQPPPGCIWDPHTQQYYYIVSSPPLPPSDPYSYPQDQAAVLAQVSPPASYELGAK